MAEWGKRFHRIPYRAVRAILVRFSDRVIPSKLWFGQLWERIDEPRIEAKPPKYEVEAEDLDVLLKSLGGDAEGLVIDPKEIVVNERVREECRNPDCPAYGLSACCPPYSPKAEETKRLLERYGYGILMRLKVSPKELSSQVMWEIFNKLRRTVGSVESMAQELGYYLALGYGAGPCVACGMFSPKWRPEKDKCSVIEGKMCKSYLFARASMEACGIDVLRTMEKVGWKPNWVDLKREPGIVKCAHWVGLVLVG